MSSEKSYDLKSEAGEAYPVLLDSKGRIIDGLHRKDRVPTWHEKTLPWVDTERKFLAMRISTNYNRREMPGDELAKDLNALAKEIVDEDGNKIGLVGKLKRETGVAGRTIRRYLDEGYKQRRAPTIHSTDESAAVAPVGMEQPPRAEEIAALPATLKTPEKGSYQLEHAVHNIISLSLGQHLDTVRRRIHDGYDLTDEEVEYYLESYKKVHAKYWNLCYDEEGNPLTREKDDTEEEPILTRAVAAPIFSPDEVLEDAMKHYPSNVIDAVWSIVPSDSKRIPFLKMLYEVLWEKIDPEEQMNYVQSAMSRMT